MFRAANFKALLYRLVPRADGPARRRYDNGMAASRTIRRARRVTPAGRVTLVENKALPAFSLKLARKNLQESVIVSTTVIRTHLTRLGLSHGIALVALLGVSSAGAQKTSAVPTPESVIGFPVGEDFKLFTYDQSIDYFRKLAAASNRVRLITVGKTAYGKTWTAVLISSPANLARLDKIRETNMKLAHPAGLTDAQARDLARQGRAIVDISGGLHASEIAGSQHTPQVAYELLSRAAEPEMKTILDSVVFFLWPSINPDGQDIVVNWCRANQPDADHNGRGAVPMELYEKYVGHDNNRDSYMLNVVESRVIQRTWREWEPDVIYVQHQSSPFPTRIWIPPFADPVGLRVPPIMAREVNAIGTRIAERLDANGNARRGLAARDVRRVVPGLHRLHADVPEHPVVVDGNAGRQLRDAAHVHRRRSPEPTTRSSARRRSTRARGRRGSGGCATR